MLHLRPHQEALLEVTLKTFNDPNMSEPMRTQLGVYGRDFTAESWHTLEEHSRSPLANTQPEKSVCSRVHATAEVLVTKIYLPLALCAICQRKGGISTGEKAVKALMW